MPKEEQIALTEHICKARSVLELLDQERPKDELGLALWEWDLELRSECIFEDNATAT